MITYFVRMTIATQLFLLLASNALAQSITKETFDKASDPEAKLGEQMISQKPVIEPEDQFRVRLRNRATPLPPPPKLDPKRIDDTNYVAEMWWEHLGYRSKESAAKSLKAQKKDSEQAGLKWRPPEPGDPYHVDEYFMMPDNERLEGCSYAPGYTYPGGCNDEKGNVIFNPSVDGQEVLDKIVKKQGKQGKYNKMPKVKPKSTVSETFYIKD